MTRFTDKEKMTVSLARMQAAVDTSPRIDSVVDAASRLFGFVSRPFRRGAIASQLRQLDDRMLTDIGMRRWQIDDVARVATADDKVTFVQAVRDLLVAISVAFVTARHRRAAYRELMALDDRMLADVGLSRGDIPAVIATIGRVPAAEDINGLDAMRVWNRSRQVSKTLNALDNRMLDDIGLVRGDIEIVAEALALRSLQPANRNGIVPQAA
jgi:uncharacterized protein YjiS (DUF1127 family)